MRKVLVGINVCFPALWKIGISPGFRFFLAQETLGAQPWISRYPIGQSKNLEERKATKLRNRGAWRQDQGDP